MFPVKRRGDRVYKKSLTQSLGADGKKPTVPIVVTKLHEYGLKVLSWRGYDKSDTNGRPPLCSSSGVTRGSANSHLC